MELADFKLLNKLLSKRDKKFIVILVFASIFVSIFETISLSALMVFIGIVTNFDYALKSKTFNAIYTFLNCSKPADFIIIMGACLLVFYIFRLFLNTSHIYAMNKFSHMRQYKISAQLFERFLNLRYKDLVLKNPTYIGQIIFSRSGNITQIVIALLSILAEFFTISCIYAMLFYVNWKMTLVLTVLLSTKVFFVAKIFSKKIALAGKISQKFAVKTARTFGESYGNYKFLKLISNNTPLLKRLKEGSLGQAQANTLNAVWQALPRYVLETIGFSILICIILYVTVMYGTAQHIIPIVSMYAIAFYRFLPSVNKLVIGYNQIMFNKHALKPVYEFLQEYVEILGSNPITFNKDVTFKNVSFRYVKKNSVLDEVNLTIPKGQRVGFVGESGSGKSTIVDILTGLFQPQNGIIEIDGIPLTLKNMRNWRQKVGYIPQSIYLFDGTVAENIVCGRKYNKEKVIASLKKAHIYDFLLTKEGIETTVGEGGVRFSGGQRQRIAIARVLYGNPDVLVLDEATSALDNKTEEKIMNEIYDGNKDKTLIIVAHRLTTIERCDKIYKIEAGKVIDATHEHIKVPKKISTSLAL